MIAPVQCPKFLVRKFDFIQIIRWTTYCGPQYKLHMCFGDYYTLLIVGY